jgi:hypothetical protein
MLFLISYLNTLYSAIGMKSIVILNFDIETEEQQ